MNKKSSTPANVSKIKLKRETLRAIKPAQLQMVAGGFSAGIICDSHNQANCK